MAEKSLFFNALPSSDYETGYDRNYNADDISDWLSVVWDNGVVKGGLAVEAATDMTVNLNVGRAAINGKAYINNTVQSFTVAANGGASTRYDYIILRFNNNIGVRSITAELVTGTTTLPTTADSLTREGNIYDLMLCYIAVEPSASTITQSNITDTRGYDDSVDTEGDYVYGDLANACPYFTAVKGYDDYYDAIIQNYESVVTMASASTLVVTTLPANLYNDAYSILEVYTNGIRENDSAYTVGTSSGYITITFTAAKNAGAKITVDLGNFIDGEGLSTAIAGYNAFTSAVTELQEANEYTYVCNGQTDNVDITNLGRAWLNGGTDYGSAKIKIVGNFGYTAMAYGEGTTASPYRLFNFSGSFNRRLILDFTDCSAISVNLPSGDYTIIFATQNLHVIGANIIASNMDADTTVKMFSNSTGYIRCENCRFWINAYSSSQIAATGTFVNCRGSVTNASGNSYCFQPADASLLTIEGGEYYAYTGVSTSTSAIVGQSKTNSISILYAVSAPTVARSGYYQTNSIYQVGNAGWVNCTDLVSELTLTVVSGKSNIRGTIALSKADIL